MCVCLCLSVCLCVCVCVCAAAVIATMQLMYWTVADACTAVLGSNVSPKLTE